MGRAPCCDKANVKKGPWSPEEDAKLKSYIEQHGTGGNWIALPQKIGLKRCGKSCRLRWLNYLRPNIKHGGFSEEEDSIICSLYISIGSRWSIIAAQLPGRTDNDIKNYWNTRLKKKLLGKQRKEKQSGKGSALKQEMKRGNHINSMAAIETNNNNHHHHNPYWPELPVLAPIPYSNQVPRLHDHTSIRKLLIKLGGRFSDDDHLVPNVPNPQFSNGFISYSTNHDFYEQSSVGTSSASMEALDTGTNNGAQFALSTPYEVNGGEAGLQVLQGQSNYPYALEEMAISNPEKLDGLEFLLGDGMAFDTKRIEQSNGEGVNVGALREMSSLVYPTAASSCGGIHQQTLYQEYAFDELRYPGSV